MITLPLCAAVAAAAVVDYDVVVYGSTPAGIAAATAAGHLGMKVALFEPLKMIGGMGAAGNLALHDGGAGTGLALNFSMLNADYYNVSKPVAQPESFVANASFFKMLDGAGVQKISLDCRLTSAAYSHSDGRVKSISVICEKTPITATVFIDASYDGEIMVATGGVDFTSGRESISKYNESLAGARKPSSGGPKVNALRDDGSLIKYVQNISELAAPGEADDSLMAFQHRMCISGDDDRLPWKKPDGYNRDDFLLFQRYIEASGGGFSGFSWPPQNMHSFGYPGPKKKYTLCCGITIAASDQPHLNKGWANATWERKQEIIAEHTYFELGMFYFLANDPQVPKAVRDRFNEYGICSDEFVEFGHIPPQLYIRESNRMVSDFVLTQNNINAPAHRADSIAYGHWWLDKHMTGKYAVPNTNAAEAGELTVQLEGNFPHSGPALPKAYDVPYAMLVPKRGTGVNLLVPVCLSVSSAAFASTRIETMLMGTGSAAGVAAAQLVEGAVSAVQDVDVGKVQAILSTTFRQQIHASSPLPPAPTAPTPAPGPPPKYFNVSGAGSPEWNDEYTLSSTQSGFYFAETCSCPDKSKCALYSYQRQWRLACHGTEVYYEAGAESGSEPPANGWTCASGSAPAPTLSAGPMGAAAV